MPLTGFRFAIAGGGPSSAVAGILLERLGAEVVRTERVEARAPVDGAVNGTSQPPTGCPFPVVAVPVPEPDPDDDWAGSGAMALTGDPDGAALAAPGWPATHLRGAGIVLDLLARMARLAGSAPPLPLDAPKLLGERAALAGLGRRGQVSVGGASRLLRAADGWIVVSLTRPADMAMVPAWLGCDRSGDPWDMVTAQIRRRPAAQAVADGQLVGLAVAEVGGAPGTADDQLAARQQPWPPAPWVIDGKRKHGGGRGRAAHPKRGPRPTSARPPLVIDLSSLWAGPLCASLLGAAGARVVKVESRTRPDGARRGTPAFFDLLNAGKQSVALDLDGQAGVGALRALIDAADVVVESARPRVTAQWGIDVPSLLAGRDRPLVWVSLTGYGRNGPWANRVAYGDDAAAAAGLVARDADGEPRFCGDAMADPIAGVHAAAAALAGLVGGGNHLIDVSLREAAGSTLLRPDGMDLAAPRRGRPPAPPVARSPLGRGRALGADTASVLAEVGHQFR